MLYNTQRPLLAMPEYGRSIQKMVELTIAIPSRQERLRCAKSIVAAMARLQPQDSGTPDYKKKLWNHLAKISQYRLDIDYPVEISAEESREHPKPLKYPTKRIRRRHYGSLVEESLKYACTLPEGKQRRMLTEMVANQMKQNLYIWNRDSMDDALVAQDILEYTDGALELDLDNFRFAPVGTPNLQQMDHTRGKARNNKKKR